MAIFKETILVLVMYFIIIGYLITNSIWIKAFIILLMLFICMSIITNFVKGKKYAN